MSIAPSQPCTSFSAPSSPHWRHLSCSSGLCTPRLGWSSHRPPVSVDARKLFLVFAVQSIACLDCCRRCCWTPCCFRVCEGRERIYERLSEVSGESALRLYPVGINKVHTSRSSSTLTDWQIEQNDNFLVPLLEVRKTTLDKRHKATKHRMINLKDLVCCVKKWILQNLLWILVAFTVREFVYLFIFLNTVQQF